MRASTQMNFETVNQRHSIKRVRYRVFKSIKQSLLLTIVVCSFALHSCEDGKEYSIDPRELRTDAELLAELNSEIRAMVSDATCDDIADCRFVGFGAKPCGGPWGYLIYCVSAVDSAKLISLVSAYFELESEINRKEGRFSDCTVPNPPQLGLVEGKCAETSGGPTTP